MKFDNMKIILCVFALTYSIAAQPVDSVRTYKLEQVTVEASRKLESKMHIEIDHKKIERTDASNLSELGKLIPSLKVRTNSRGESLFYLRGAGERQIALFFDGVILNTPWDNRIDLSMIPSDMIGDISVTKGVPSVIYGANSVSGVININSFRLNPGKRFGKVLAQFSENNTRRFSGSYFMNNEKLSAGFTSSYRKTDGFNLPNSYTDVNNSSSLRLNSYSRAVDLFGNVNYKYSANGSLGLGASFTNSEKGVPPETDVANPRYWQYPAFTRIMVSLNGNYFFNRLSNSKLDYTFAATSVYSKINQYTNATFSEIDDVEKSNDFTASGRFLYSGIVTENSIIKAALNTLTTTHEEKILSAGYNDELYRQNLISVGAEYEYFIGRTAAIIGLGYDYSSTPLTGDKTPKAPVSDISFSGGIVYSISDLHSVYISFGRKTRFPTLRETFSGALGRFVPNPQLRAEIVHSGEIGFNSLLPGGKIELNFFLSYLKDGIVRESLPGRQFRRVNKEQIRTAGAELNVNYILADGFNASFHLTYLNAFAKDVNGNFKDTLEYKPNFISLLTLHYYFSKNIETQLEFNYSSKEFALREGSTFFQRLPDYMLVNLRLAYNFRIFNDLRLELFARVNNMFDKLYFPQWGLPEAGRQIWGGVSLEF